MITPDQLRKCAVCVYLAAEAGPAADIAKHLNLAADSIETQSAELARAKGLVSDFLVFLSTSFYGPGWVERFEKLNRDCKSFLHPPAPEAEQTGSESLCTAPCPHSSFEQLSCSLPQGHAGPHKWKPATPPPGSQEGEFVRVRRVLLEAMNRYLTEAWDYTSPYGEELKAALGLGEEPT